MRSSDPIMSGTFYIGTTILSLEVTDNSGDKAVAWTYVSIRSPLAWEKSTPQTTAVLPDSGPTYGGTPVTVKGFGMYNSPRVYFGDSEAKIISSTSNTEVTVEAPPGTGAVKVSVSNGFGDGTSKATFTYYESNVSQVKFKDDVVRNTDGSEFSIPEITSIALGPDGLYYACSLDGYIYVLEINSDMQVVHSCKSSNVGQNRAALGIAFHPSDTELPPKAFVSTSTLYWKNKKTGDNWDNGKIEIWQKGAGDNDCMGYLYDVVSGLPVSNHDHGVNAMGFLLNGDLLVAVGGSTNAGVHTDDDGIGGIPESPLSSAILRFSLSKGDKFNGKIEYDQVDDAGSAHVVSGDVDVYSSGIRNCFGLTTHSGGAVYAMSNGANGGLGLASADCSRSGGSVSAQDGLLNVKENHYYGHPNRNRGRYDERQCSYQDKTASKGFTQAMQIFSSSTNGIIEYTANTFEFQLRGNLFLSKLAWDGPGKVHRVILSEGGESVAQSSEFWPDGGLSMVMSPYGDIIMPKVKQDKILVLRPEYTPNTKVHVRAVSPRRGPHGGGYSVMVTGSGFVPDMSLKFGNLACTNFSRFSEDGSSVWCKVPAGTVGATVPVVAIVNGESSPRHEHGDFEYIW
jgi:IPT/TIG domain/Glucose / Sorbosone dehydrogenase